MANIQISQLTAVDTLAASDLVPIFSSTNGDTRKASMTAISTFVEDNISVNDDKVTQYSAPSATGFTVTLVDSSASKWLILTPAAGYAAGTITLPAVANCVDRQEILVNCTQAVTTLTISANGATAVTGAPTTLAANAFFRLRYDSATSTWYRVG